MAVGFFWFFFTCFEFPHVALLKGEKALLQTFLLQSYYFIGRQQSLTCFALQRDALSISELVSWATLEAAICCHTDGAV